METNAAVGTSDDENLWICYKTAVDADLLFQKDPEYHRRIRTASQSTQAVIVRSQVASKTGTAVFDHHPVPYGDVQLELG